MLEEAYELHKTGRLAEAESRYREWLGFNPEDPDGLHLLSVVRRQLGAIGEALQLARAAVALRPDRANYYITLAGIEFHARQWAAARADFETALKLDPNQTAAYSALGHIARIQGDDARAEENFKRALLTEQDRADVLIGYGNLLADRGDFAAAVQYLARAARIDPDNSATQASFGRALLANGQWAFAEAALENAVRLRPDSPATLRTLLQAHRERRDFVAAERALERLAALPNQSKAAAAERAELAHARGDLEAAVEGYGAWHVLDPDHPEPLHRQVALLQGMGRREAAITAYRERVSQYPDDVRSLRGLASLLVRQDQAAEALPLLRHAAAVAPDDADVLAALAAVLDQQGGGEEAESLARRALEYAPQQASAAALLLNAALMRGDTEAAAAVSTALDGASLTPAQQAAWNGLRGHAAHHAGDVGTAIAHWRTANAARGKNPPPRVRALSKEGADMVGRGDVASTPLVARVPKAFLLGTPGSCAELIAALLTDNDYLVLTDRFRSDGRNDALRKLEAERYAFGIGDTDARLFARQYERAMARLPIPPDASLIDWLPAWDARMSVPVRAVLGPVPIILATDDPREALLNWMAFGTRAGWVVSDEQESARWLSVALEHLIATAQRSGLPVLALNTAELLDDPVACGRRLGALLGTEPLAPGSRYSRERKPERTLPARLAPGEWRRFSEPLTPAFTAFDDLARDLRE